MMHCAVASQDIMVHYCNIGVGYVTLGKSV